LEEFQEATLVFGKQQGGGFFENKPLFSWGDQEKTRDTSAEAGEKRS